jgi:hypothetical protein
MCSKNGRTPGISGTTPLPASDRANGFTRRHHEEGQRDLKSPSRTV